jgi:hypothetical protein
VQKTRKSWQFPHMRKRSYVMASPA